MNRYDRQLKFKGIGVDGQNTLEQSTVGIVGMGALGTHTANSLVRAGIKKLIIVDRDYVEITNLQRQTLFNEDDVSMLKPKVIAAKEALIQIRNDIEIDAYIEHCDAPLLEAAFSQCDIIIDGSDNFEVRQVINDFSYKHHIPWIYGAVVESTYVACPFIPGITPCFNCVIGALPVMNRTCDTVGVIEPAVAMTTSYQTMYAMKILTQAEFEPKLIYGDIWTLEHTAIKYGRMRKHDCSTCGEAPTYPYLSTRHQEMMLCGRDTVQFTTKLSTRETLMHYLDRLNITYKTTPYFVRFHFNDKPMLWFNGGRLLVHEVKTINEARTIYNQLFG